MAATNTGAVIAPKLDPALNKPLAKALSFLGNHSTTDFTAAGKLAACPIPKEKRAAAKPGAGAWQLAEPYGGAGGAALRRLTWEAHGTSLRRRWE